LRFFNCISAKSSRTAKRSTVLDSLLPKLTICITLFFDQFLHVFNSVLLFFITFFAFSSCVVLNKLTFNYRCIFYRQSNDYATGEVYQVKSKFSKKVSISRSWQCDHWLMKRLIISDKYRYR